MTPTEREVLRETLIGARWLIREPRLWVQGVFREGDRRCAAAAIGAVISSLKNRGLLLGAVFKYLRAETGDVEIDKWQDAPERTHAEVLALFDRAIERLK